MRLTTPIFKNEALNKALAENEHATRIARLDTDPRWINHRDGTRSKTFDTLRVQQVQVNMTHHQWVQSLVDSKNPADRSFAKEMLGTTRFDLVKSGKLTVDRLYYGGKKITIADLKKEYIK